MNEALKDGKLKRLDNKNQKYMKKNCNHIEIGMLEIKTVKNGNNAKQNQKKSIVIIVNIQNASVDQV